MKPTKHDHLDAALRALGEQPSTPPERRSLRRGEGTPAPDSSGSALAEQTTRQVEVLLEARRLRDLSKRLAQRRLGRDQKVRIAARSVASWERANASEEVAAFRTEELSKEHIPIDAVAQWIGRAESRRDRTAKNWGWLEFPTEDGVHQLRVAAGGPLHRLREAANRTAAFYRWEPAWATAFLLSGAIPIVEQVIVTTRRTRSGRRMVLECDPDLSPRALLAAFEEGRQRTSSRGVPKSESFEMLAEWIVLGRPTFETFTEDWNAANGTEYRPDNCRERIARVCAFLEI